MPAMTSSRRDAAWCLRRRRPPLSERIELAWVAVVVEDKELKGTEEAHRSSCIYIRTEIQNEPRRPGKELHPWPRLLLCIQEGRMPTCEFYYKI